MEILNNRIAINFSKRLAGYVKILKITTRIILEKQNTGTFLLILEKWYNSPLENIHKT